MHFHAQLECAGVQCTNHSIGLRIRVRIQCKSKRSRFTRLDAVMWRGVLSIGFKRHSKILTGHLRLRASNPLISQNIAVDIIKQRRVNLRPINFSDHTVHRVIRRQKRVLKSKCGLRFIRFHKHSKLLAQQAQGRGVPFMSPRRQDVERAVNRVRTRRRHPQTRHDGDGTDHPHPLSLNSTHNPTPPRSIFCICDASQTRLLAISSDYTIRICSKILANPEKR